MRVLAWTPLWVTLGACQPGDVDVSTSERTVTTTVPEQARMVDMTVHATQNHSSGDCFCTVHNETQHGDGSTPRCTQHWRHGGRWVMRWEAYCEREDAAACINSYPVVTGGRKTETTTWKGANEHFDTWPFFEYGSCAKWTWGSSWEGANYCEGRSQAEVAASEGSGAPNVFVAAGVGYGMKHGDGGLYVTPSVGVVAGENGIGAGASAGLEFSYENVSWGNGYEIRCQYRCNHQPASDEMALQEKCWAAGWDNSDERTPAGGAHHSEIGLQLDNTWRELARRPCADDDKKDGGCSNRRTPWSHPTDRW